MFLSTIAGDFLHYRPFLTKSMLAPLFRTHSTLQTILRWRFCMDDGHSVGDLIPGLRGDFRIYASKPIYYGSVIILSPMSKISTCCGGVRILTAEQLHLPVNSGWGGPSPPVGGSSDTGLSCFPFRISLSKSPPPPLSPPPPPLSPPAPGSTCFNSRPLFIWSSRLLRSSETTGREALKRNT